MRRPQNCCNNPIRERLQDASPDLARSAPLVSAVNCLLGMLVWFVALTGPIATADEPRPNIILILADDLGINDLRCYGRSENETPNLDALAAAGARFTCAYSAQSICSPSRAALLTGKSPARLHLTSYLPGRPDTASQKLLQPIIEGQLPLEEQTLAESLRGAGYRTGMFGKWHLGGQGFGPEEQGFEVVASPPADSQPSDRDGGKSEFAITRAASEFIEANRDQPFFCFVAHHSPHIPLAARKALVDKNRNTFNPEYAAMVETLDEAVGQLLSKVEQLGLADRTIVVFTSDNGGLHVLEFPGTPSTHNTPFRAGKGYLYEGGLRVPLIVRWPGVIEAGRVSETPVLLTDLMPTLLEAAGINTAKTTGPLDGRNLLGLWRGEELQTQPLFWHFPHYTNQGGRPGGAIRLGDWKLIENFEDGSLELYDLAQDRGESINLSEQEGQRAEDLQRQLSEWRTRVGAQLPTPNPEWDSTLHRQLYLDRNPSQVAPAATAAAIETDWAGWRALMNRVVIGRKAEVTPATGTIRLQAKDAIVHAETMRYEPEPHKNVLGYWVNPNDWAEWRFDVPVGGVYEVEIQQGCGNGSGGAEVDLEIGGKSLRFKVVETGHFQNMIQLPIGEVELAAGKQTLAIKPKTKPGPAVMDIRRVVLRPK